ncbi:MULTISPECIES: hypothetical protein [unclassified Xanthomonas]|uniref:hypothetical protein n=1 Tax=unclassified Xanthomonas TaxID=2643310 RepID=UPI00136A27B8|nr:MULTISPECIES: hypothetical protein [unclassified Xanthomonas]MBB6365580.1 hypothetical protein [Xanthomonas sp. F10]MXV32055.1 hypothetical protein [Xanthomonas sp. LMG 8989]UYC13713.1 hypothetical protein NUG21_08315 [Xanthomonas sp. CFBP 8445]
MALLWAMAGAAMAAPDQGEHAGEQGGSGAEAPYIEHVGSECVMVNTYLQRRDGVVERVVLREPVQCAGQPDQRSMADLRN